MRAGAFAERRVIDLLNRRFVSYFYNTGGPGEGHNDAAAAFVKGKVPNQWAFFSAFTPEGEIVGTSDIYASKDDVFDFLARLLREYPALDQDTAEETATIDAGTKADAEPAAKAAAAALLEELGRYEGALRIQTTLAKDLPSPSAIHAAISCMRIRRLQHDWYGQEDWEKKLRASVQGESLVAIEDDLLLEECYRMVNWRTYSTAKPKLQAATKKYENSDRIAEIHFLAGVACWFCDDRDWAKFHWCWIINNRPEDRLKMRASIAAAAEHMPYPNPELGGFAAKGNIGPQHITAEIAKSQKIFQELKAAFDRGDFKAKRGDAAKSKPPAPGKTDGAASALVAKLKDGNDNVPSNNRIVKQLIDLGEPSIAALVAALNDSEFEGRGYAGWALGHVLAATGKRPKDAMDALEACLKSDDPYVVALSHNGKKAVEEGDKGTWKHPFK